MHKKGKFGQPSQAELKRLLKELFVAKKKAQEIFLRSVLQNEGRRWTEFCKYVKRRKGNKKIFRLTRTQMASALQILKEKPNPKLLLCVSIHSRT
jgi:hypothetical protein